MNDAYWLTCVHEAAHAVFAQHHGWPVRSVDADAALTVIAEPTEPGWWQHLALAAQCLAGEYAAYVALDRDYPFRDLLDARTCEDEREDAWRCDGCRAIGHLRAAIPKPVASGVPSGYLLVQSQVVTCVRSWRDEITVLAQELRDKRRIAEPAT